MAIAPTIGRGRSIGVFRKLRRDSQLRLLTTLGFSAAALLLCFGVYRFLEGAILAAAVDFTVSAAISILVVYALRSGNTERTGVALCIVDTFACILACLTIGAIAVHWHYVVLVTNFFITSRRIALIANLLLTAFVLIILGPSQTPILSVSIAASGALVTLFTYFFATRIKVDRNRLEEIASVDVLTGLSNRRTMEQALSHAMELHRTEGVAYGLIILDIDDFKQVNDEHGHAAGDAVLQDLAEILGRQMRKQDNVFRFGGEEFVVLVEVSKVDELRVAAERIRLAIRASLNGPAGLITVSVGAALLGAEENWQEWFSLADAALYRAKTAGRDQSMISE